MKRILALILGSIVLVGGGWFLAQGTARTPKQRVADSAVRPSPQVMAAATRGVLRDSVELSGRVGRITQVDVFPPDRPPGAYASVVTRTPRWPKPLRAPFVAVEVSGMPLVAVPSRTPFYRRIHANDSGPDVDAVLAVLHDARLLTSGHHAFDRAAQQAFWVWWTERLSLQPSALGVSAAKVAGGDVKGLVVPTEAFRSVPSGDLIVTKALPKVGTLVAPDDVIFGLGGGPQGVLAQTPPANGLTLAVRGKVILQGPEGAINSSISRVTSGKDGVDTVTVPLPTGSSIADGATVPMRVVLRATRRPVLSVPVGAVREGSDGTYVLVPQGSAGQPRRVAVRVGEAFGGAVVIDDGHLVAGQKVLLDVGQP
jgi:hypothetical protein